jgi:beta-glucanase (GH16 family)
MQGSLLALVICLVLLGWGNRVQASVIRTQDGPPGDPAAWHISFDDEFNGTSVDTTKWYICAPTNYSHPTDDCVDYLGEMAWYVPDGVDVHNGLLFLCANQHTYQTSDGSTFQYESGKIDTFGKPGIQYGYMEARFKIPAGKALWPAFWSVPTDHDHITEIDIMEFIDQLPFEINMVDHYSQFGIAASDGSYWNGPDFSAGYHTVGVDWEKNSLTWYVDGIARKHVTRTAEIPQTPMELILSLAVGGNYPGAPDATTHFPSCLTVDWVRVWQHGTTTTTTPTQAAVASTPQAPISSNTARKPVASSNVAWLLTFAVGCSITATILITIFLFAGRRFRQARS